MVIAWMDVLLLGWHVGGLLDISTKFKIVFQEAIPGWRWYLRWVAAFNILIIGGDDICTG